MKITYCGPISLALVADAFKLDIKNLKGYQYPLGAYLCKQYYEQGHAVQIVTCTTEITQPLKLTAERLNITIVPRRRHFKFVLDAYRSERQHMKSAILEYKPDVVHAQWCYEFAHAAQDSKYPNLVTIRDVPYQILKQARTPYRLFRYFYAKKVLRRCSNISCISPYVENELHDWFLKNAKVNIITNGLEKQYFKGRLNFPQNALRLISITGTDQRKNFSLVFEAFVNFLKKMPQATLVVCGSGLNEQGLWAKEAKRLGLSDHFEWRGACSHTQILTELLPGSDIFLTATKEESFCMAVLEAMATGVPVVALKGIGAIPWLVEEGRSGLLIDNSDPAEWADELYKLSISSEDRRRYSANGFNRAKEFELSMVASHYTSLFQQIISNS